ncbi:hypothetical protein DFP73DRAFT_524740 [Morchella snyderi]|nr:hypothetical protein DFP73DRAFT_524740 [Morchella snyderi]
MCTKATTVPATHLDIAPTSGHDLVHLLAQRHAAEEQHCVLVLLRPQGKEYDDFTEAEWQIEKEVRDLNMEMHRLGAHIHELEMERLWGLEQEAGGGGSVGWASGEEREMVLCGRSSSLKALKANSHTELPTIGTQVPSPPKPLPIPNHTDTQMVGSSSLCPWEDWMDWELDQEWRTESYYRQLHFLHNMYYEMVTFANEHWQTPDQPGVIARGSSTSWRSVSDKWTVTEWYRWKMDEVQMIQWEIKLRKHILFMIYADRQRMMKK